MDNPTLWNQILVWPIMNVLVAFIKFFEWLHVPGAFGFAIIAMTIFMRILLYPLMNAQLKSAKKMANLKPHLDALSQKHKNDKQALQQAQMNLYKEHGINPAAGCLPLLVQFPVLIALYNVFYQVFNTGNMAKEIEIINKILYIPALKLQTIDLNFFGVSLGIKPSQWQTHGVWLLAIPVITGLLQWYQTKLMMAGNQSAVQSPKAEVVSKKQDEKNKKLLAQGGKPKEEEKKPEDTAMEMQKQMAIITPVMFGYFALQFPLGLALYWNVFGIFGIMQQLVVNKRTK
jgi:YidC/Oxa1 family membrane protein insertase